MTPLEMIAECEYMIYVVRSCVAYEGAEAVRGFGNKGDAEAFVAKCAAYDKTKPWNLDDLKDWMLSHPAGEDGHGDFYIIDEIPFVAGATMRPCAHP
jgi:hypothetical protein